MCERSFAYVRIKTRVQPLCIRVSLSKNLVEFRRRSGEKSQTLLSKKETFLTATNAGAECSAPARVMRFLRQPKIRSSCRRPMHAR